MNIGHSHNLFFENALPDEVFKYFSNANAFCLFVKAIAVIIFQGIYFEVCLHLPWL